MAVHELARGGYPLTSANTNYGMIPQKRVGAYDYNEAAAHGRPSQFILTRKLWWRTQAPMEIESTASEALEQYLRDLRAGGGDVKVGDKLVLMSLPIDYVLEYLFIRVDKALTGFTFDLRVVDKDDNTVHAPFTNINGGLAHRAVSNATPPVITENIIDPVNMETVHGAPMLLGHNHTLVMVVTGLPPEGIDESQVTIAAQVSVPWMGNW